MKTLLVSGIYPPDVGGPATYIPKIAGRMIDQGIDVEVLTLRNQENLIPVSPCTVNFVAREGLLVLRMLRVILLSIKKLRQSDAVLANGLHQEIAVGLCFSSVRSIAKIVGDPVWERARNKGETKVAMSEFKKLSLRQQCERILLVWSLNKFDLVICPSVELTEMVKYWGVKSKVKYVPNGVPETNQPFSIKEYDVCSASRLVKWKNIDRIIDACSLAGAALAVAGDGPEISLLESKSRQVLSPIDFLGQLNDSQVNKLLSKSRIFVLFSDYEGLSFGLLKAMSLGMPIVVSDAPGNLEVLEDRTDCIVVPRGDTQKLSGAIRELLDNPGLADELGANALKKAKNNYSETVLLDRVICLLKATS
jgi:glycosyltransferase involved in cell wall biosynthesis